MKLSIREKKVLYAFACPNHHNTVTRLKCLPPHLLQQYGEGGDESKDAPVSDGA